MDALAARHPDVHEIIAQRAAALRENETLSGKAETESKT